MALSELVLSLTIWIGAATGQPPVDAPPIKIMPAALLHYQYCETTAPDSIDDCLAERFTSPAFLDSSTGVIFLSQRFKPASDLDRANLVVQLARYAGELALRKAGHTAKYEGHEGIIDCGIHFERAARDLGRAFLAENGATSVALPFEVEDGMKPWSCSPVGAAQTAGTPAEPGF